MRTKMMVVILTILLGGLILTNSYADDLSRSKSEPASMMHKLGRGVVNIFTGWIEIPKNIAIEWKKSDPFSGFFIGFFKGLAWTWGRTLCGVYDVITFPLPIPEHYAPLMEPEFILPDIWGADFPHYDEPL
ncbi:exosortase system-associated protein, TIGR04073 family [Candidatus Sumerlaeota bacterium]|nr:exosortase system-associated protein, TIGR04073 family [Candidatus Sumerlaeota bacterium]